MLKTNLRYKILPRIHSNCKVEKNQNVFVNYYDLRKVFLHEQFNWKRFQKTNIHSKYSFSKFFLKNAGKFYSCLRPYLLQELTIFDQKSKFQLETNLSSNIVDLSNSDEQNEEIESENHSPQRTILLRLSKLLLNPNRKQSINNDKNELMLVKFI